MRRAPAVLPVLVALGIGGEWAPLAQGTTAPARPTTTAALRREARRALLRPADLGRGWHLAAAADRIPPPLACGVAGHAARTVAGSASATYSNSSSGPFLTSYSYVFARAIQRSRAWHALRGAALVRCARRRFAAGSSGAVTLRADRVLLTSTPGGGFLAAAEVLARVSGTATSGGQSAPAYLDVVFLGRARRICSLELATLDDPPQPGLERRLMHSLSARMSG